MDETKHSNACSNKSFCERGLAFDVIVL
jgi:hypothetical protein